MATVDVAEFGAVPGDGKSDTKAVVAAIEECRKNKASVLAFPKGQYDLYSDDVASGHLFDINDLDDLTIDGGGSTFMIHGYKGPFLIQKCKNLTVKNLVIDYARPPYSLGHVVAVSEKSFDVQIDPKYPVTGPEGCAAYMEFDPKAGHAARNAVEEYNSSTSTELVGPQVMRVNLIHKPRIKNGVWVLLRHATYGGNGFVVADCRNFRLQDVTIHTIPGMGFVAANSENVSLKGYRVVPRAGYPMSATADGMHFSGNKGLIDIQDCEFDGMGDDACNIKSGLYLKVTEKIDAQTVLAQHNLKLLDSPSPGDTMEVSHHPDMRAYGTDVVESVEVLQDNVQRIRFKSALPADLAVGDFLGNATRVAKVRIKNVTVRNNRARGFLLQSRDVVVENCKFTNCTMGGIWVLTEVFYFCESTTSRDVVVRNCTFDNCGYWPSPGVLTAFVHTGGDSYTASPGAHTNIVLEKNRIIGSDSTGIFIDGVDGATLRNNTVEQVCRQPWGQHGTAAIYLMGSENVTLEKNTCQADKQGAGCKQTFEMGPGVDKNTVKLTGNIGF